MSSKSSSQGTGSPRSSETPPMYPRSSSSRTHSSSSFLSNKSSKNRSGDSPHASANNEGGRRTLNELCRSILSHSLGLILTCGMYNVCYPETLRPQKESRDELAELVSGENSCSTTDNIVYEAVRNWETTDKEPRLTADICKRITENRTLNFHADGQVDVYNDIIETRKYGSMDICLFSKEQGSNNNKATPLAVIEVGLNNKEWWSKFDQQRKYNEAMLNFPHDSSNAAKSQKQVKFTEPMLIGILTLEKTEANVLSKFGVFLFTPKTGECRIILLFNQLYTDLQALSGAFGRFLRVASWFSKNKNNDVTPVYEYLSSTCCRIGDRVLRVYDERFRTTQRSPQIYLDQNCKGITGKVETVFQLLVDQSNDNGDIGFWSCRKVSTPENGSNPNYLGQRGLLVIATYYKDGQHNASKPSDFIPLIKELRSLQDKDYVHGDIRAFNVLFRSDNDRTDSGGLIDFDFSGKAKERQYPCGYKDSLVDGDRIGSEGEVLEKWHDWFAIGKLMFFIHKFKERMDDVPQEKKDLYRALYSQWSDLNGAEINIHNETKALANSLGKLDEYYRVVPSIKFEKYLRSTVKPMPTGMGKSTGNPPKKPQNFQKEDETYSELVQ